MNFQIKFKLLIAFSAFLYAAHLSAAAIFTPQSQPTGWLARPVLSSLDIQSGNENFYQLDYARDTWSGNIQAYKISSNAVIQSNGPWDSNNPTLTSAATLLDTNTNRLVVTRNASGANVAFTWSNLSGPFGTLGTQQNSISNNATTGANIVNYVRGDRSNEEPNGVAFRARDHVLGDIIHSTLHYWKHNASTRQLYVGANDGMLHVFNADTGQEVFAYIPSMVIPNLNKLIAQPYVHTPFVDGPLSIAKADFAGTLKTLLVGGLGGGGKGLYSLDITDPSPADAAAAASKIKWEITPDTTGFANLGYTYAAPRIVRLNNGVVAAIVGNGYMNGGNGHAVLYLINADTGALIKAIDTGAGTGTSPNGLSSPAIADVNSDGKVDYAYAGDIDGKLWKFDLTGNDPSLYKVVDRTGGSQPFFTTSPAQAITTAPAVTTHPNGGRMVTFATGRILTSGDISDTSAHYVYGIWDGAPSANNQLLTQTLSSATFSLNNVNLKIRTITANTPNWVAGSGNHYGWKIELPLGERVVGENPFIANGRFYFVSTNPNTLAQAPNNGENWLHEVVALTGGSPAAPIFDINQDGSFNGSDLAKDCTVGGNITCVPVGKYLMSGVFSQPTYVEGNSFATTLYTFHPDLPVTGSGGGVVVDPPDPGVSGGHFDYDIYYFTSGTSTVAKPTEMSQTKGPFCLKPGDIAAEYNKISTKYCTTAAPYKFSPGYTFLTSYIKTNPTKTCAKDSYDQTITCNTTTTVTYSNGYDNKLHVHEYDDKFGVTGVNMLNASNPGFNLTPAKLAPGVTAPTTGTTPFKMLVMNQYLNPAATLAVGGPVFQSVKTFKNLASETNPVQLMQNLPTYRLNNISTFVFNLPTDAFASKDWWGDGGPVRAGLIPSVTGCVHDVDSNGVTSDIGPNGERYRGALTIQLIRSDTPATALELNHNGNGGLTDAQRVKYGWRVKQADFKQYVLAEYTAFWHHPNGKCYGLAGWVADPPQSLDSATASTPPAGTEDPKFGTFSGTGGIIKTETTVNGNTTTKVVTYTNGTTYTRTDVNNGDGTTTVTQTFTDGSTTVTTIPIISGGSGGSGTGGGGSGFGDNDPNSCGDHACSDKEPIAGEKEGRLSWRELIR